ncbi:MAG: RnfABCDGE type electron transport complex subunit D [Clostridiales bacterium]|nr:RnfABCDGE type electron transport complex subunit D [Clostridiales bacterium]
MHGIRPHIRATRTTKEIMSDVVIALVPALIGSIYFFGIQSLILVLTAVTTCVLSEYLWQRLRKEPIRVGDVSAVVTGILLAFNFPATTPIWIIMVASVFSIIVAKQIFGGIGNNFANPALMGRALIMLLWPGNIAQYVTTNHGAADAVSSATVLSLLKSGKEIVDYSYLDMFIGNIPGALGETSKLLLLIGFLYLCYRQVVNFSATLTYIITVVAITFIFGGDGFFTGDILTNLLGGGLILGACFMITDYPSVAPRVKVSIAFLAGVITAYIRIWGILPEGVCFGILVGNCLSGLVEQVIRPHIYGVNLKKSNLN